MREMIKFSLHVICFVVVSPLAIPIWLVAKCDSQEKAFQFSSHLISLVPGIPGEFLRRAFYHWILDCTAPGPTIGFGSIFAQRDTSISNRVYIGMFCNIGSSTIGEDVLIGSHVMIASPGMHHFDSLDLPISQQGGETEKILIGDGAWLGNGSIILNEVGRGCVIAAGAVVVKKCEENGIYGGNPAKLIRKRGEDL